MNEESSINVDTQEILHLSRKLSKGKKRRLSIGEIEEKDEYDSGS